MHSTTPSGVRRICPIVPSTTMKREFALSSSFRAWIVALMYSTVRSNSFSESAKLLPISHMISWTTWRRCATIFRVKSSMQAIRSPTDIVGHSPRPFAYAATAAASASSLSGSAISG